MVLGDARIGVPRGPALCFSLPYHLLGQRWDSDMTTYVVVKLHAQVLAVEVLDGSRR